MSFIDDLNWLDWQFRHDEVNRQRFELMCNQNIWWHPVRGGLIKISNMEPTHVFNLMNWLERNYDLYKERYDPGYRYGLNDSPLYKKLVQMHYDFMSNFGVVT